MDGQTNPFAALSFIIAPAVLTNASAILTLSTSLDWSRSPEYCSHCFREGHFTESEIPAVEMVLKVEEILRSMHFPGFLGRRFT